MVAWLTRGMVDPVREDIVREADSVSKAECLLCFFPAEGRHVATVRSQTALRTPPCRRQPGRHFFQSQYPTIRALNSLTRCHSERCFHAAGSIARAER